MRAKKLLSILLTLVLVAGLIPVTAQAATYSDVPEKHWAASAIDRWSDYGVVTGDQGKFRPDADMTRAEAAAVFARLLALTDDAANKTFSDLPANHWAYSAMNKAVNAGIITGSDTGKALPDAKLDRQTFFIMFARALGIKPQDTTSSSLVSDGDFWANGYINALTDKGYVKGGGTSSVNAKGGVTRASVMTLLDQTVTVYANEDGKTYEGTGTGVLLVTADDCTITGKVDTLVIAGGAENVDTSAVETKADGSVSGTLTLAAGRKQIKLVNAIVALLNLVSSHSSVDIGAGSAVTTVALTEQADNAEIAVAAGASVETLETAAADTAISNSGVITSVEVAETATGAAVTAAAGSYTGVVDTKASGTAVSGAGAVANVVASGNAASGTSAAKVETKGTKTATVDSTGKTTTATTSGSLPAASSANATAATSAASKATAAASEAVKAAETGASSSESGTTPTTPSTGGGTTGGGSSSGGTTPTPTPTPSGNLTVKVTLKDASGNVVGTAMKVYLGTLEATVDTDLKYATFTNVAAGSYTIDVEGKIVTEGANVTVSASALEFTATVADDTTSKATAALKDASIKAGEAATVNITGAVDKTNNWLTGAHKVTITTTIDSKATTVFDANVTFDSKGAGSAVIPTGTFTKKGSYTLTVKVAGITDSKITSSSLSLTVTAGDAAALKVTTGAKSPVASSSTENLTAIVVGFVDAYDNAVTVSESTAVTASTADSTWTLGGTKTVTGTSSFSFDALTAENNGRTAVTATITFTATVGGKAMTATTSFSLAGVGQSAAPATAVLDRSAKTIVVTPVANSGLAAGDKVAVYAAETGGSAIASHTVGSGETSSITLTLTNSELAAITGNVWVSLTIGSNPESLRTQSTGFKWSLTYDLNGGTGSAPTASVSDANVETVNNGSGLTKAGYIFSGWTEQADGTGTVYQSDGDNKTITLTKDTTLYAKWVKSVTVTFDANGGTGTLAAMTSQAAGSEVTVTANTDSGITRAGYTFAGWNTKADGTGTAVANKGKLTVTDDVTLYAQWTPVTYEVTYHNGVDAEATTLAFVNGKAVTVAAGTTKADSVFQGWATAKNATEATYAAGKTLTVITGTTETSPDADGNYIIATALSPLYAVWKANEHKITVTINGTGAYTTNDTNAANTFSVDGVEAAKIKKTSTKDANGEDVAKFEVTVTNGTYYLTAKLGDNVATTSVTVNGADAAATLEPKEAAYTVTVTASGVAKDTVATLTDTAASNKKVIAPVKAGESGSIVFNNVPAGTYTLAIAGYSISAEDVEIKVTNAAVTKTVTATAVGVTIASGSGADGLKKNVAGSFTVTATLTGTKFVAGTVVSGDTTLSAAGFSFASLPDGMAITKAVRTGDTTATITVSGTPTAASADGGDSIGALTVKAAVLDGWTEDVVSASADVKATIAETYTVTFDSNGGNKVDSVVVAKDGALTAPENVTKSGYVLLGWYNGVTEWVFTADDNANKVTSDMTLKADWARPYVITWDDDTTQELTTAAVTAQVGAKVKSITITTGAEGDLKGVETSTKISAVLFPTNGGDGVVQTKNYAKTLSITTTKYGTITATVEPVNEVAAEALKVGKVGFYKGEATGSETLDSALFTLTVTGTPAITYLFMWGEDSDATLPARTTATSVTVEQSAVVESICIIGLADDMYSKGVLNGNNVISNTFTGTWQGEEVERKLITPDYGKVTVVKEGDMVTVVIEPNENSKTAAVAGTVEFFLNVSGIENKTEDELKALTPLFTLTVEEATANP